MTKHKQVQIQSKEKKRNFPLQLLRVDSTSFIKRQNYLQLKDLCRITPMHENCSQKNNLKHKTEQSTCRRKQQIKTVQNTIQKEQKKRRSITVSAAKNSSSLKLSSTYLSSQQKTKMNRNLSMYPQSSKNNKLAINNQNLFTSLNKIAQKLEEISQVHMQKVFMSQMQNFYENISTKSEQYCWILRKIFSLIDYCQKRRSDFFISQQYYQTQGQKLQLLAQINRKEIKMQCLTQKSKQNEKIIQQLQLSGPTTYVCNCKSKIKAQQLNNIMQQLDLSQISEVNSIQKHLQGMSIQNQLFDKKLLKKGEITSSQNQFLQQKTIQKSKRGSLLTQIENKSTINNNRSSLIRQKFANIVKNNQGSRY